PFRPPRRCPGKPAIPDVSGPVPAGARSGVAPQGNLEDRFLMIHHEQYLQDVQILISLYSSCADVLYGGKPKHPHWTAIFLEGPMDQLRQAQAEIHEYLALPNPLPDVALPADSDEVPPITNADAFRLALERLRRLYLV